MPNWSSRRSPAPGFEFVAASELLHNPDDPHTAKVFEMQGKSDKFLLKFRKPKDHPVEAAR